MQELRDRLLDFAERDFATGEAFGLACGITLGDCREEVYVGGERFNSDSVFRLASVTKMFTAAAVMKLYGEGKLDIYAPVSKYIGGFENLSIGSLMPDGRIISCQKPSREVTLFDLLTHTAGLGADELGNREYALIPPDKKVSLASVTEYYRDNFHLAFDVGTRSAYSGFAGYDVLARVVENICGTTFGEYLSKNIAEPLGLKDTTFQPSEEQYLRIVPMHQRISGEDKEINFRGTLFRSLPRTYEAAGASLISSLGDVLRFCQMLLHGGEGIIRPEHVKMMLTGRLDDGLFGLERGENNGFGCFCVTGEHRLKKGTVFCHGAYGTHVILRPEENFAAVLLKNSLYGMANLPKSVIEFEKAVLR